ncbi:MAG: hypothetical protein ACYS6K_28320, partial [Planctomycetota bacterium]
MVTLKKATTLNKNRFSNQINILILLALAADLITPFTIWKGVLPSFTRWISHAAVAIIIFGVIVRMLVFDRFPGFVWLIGGITAIGFVVALYNGQGITATVWGWWIMFQFPFVGLFAYLQPGWPERFSQRLGTVCVAILGLVLIVQVGQYLAGTPPGDQLAGLFGQNGTGNLIIFIILVLCMALGKWIAYGEWTTLAWVLVLGSASSVLGELKIFIPVVLVLGV